MKKLSVFSLLIFGFLLMGTNADAMPTQVISLGDETVEMVQTGYSGTNKENLAWWFAQNDIANPDGSAIDPVEDQLQYELFFTDTTREYEVEFLGIGHAGYHSPFGVFTYSADISQGFDSAYMTYYEPLFVQNKVKTNTTYNFTVAAGTYFGFYLDSNGTGTELTTLVAANPRATSNRISNREVYASGLDHALFYETNKGYTIAFEDIVGGGDFDFEDLVVNFSPTDGSGFTTAAAVPEPATVMLLGIGLICMGRLPKKIMVKR
ncbi:MAG: DUF4114 domain-containing protein [Desulfobacterales bacterium]